MFTVLLYLVTNSFCFWFGAQGLLLALGSEDHTGATLGTIYSAWFWVAGVICMQGKSINPWNSHSHLIANSLFPAIFKPILVLGVSLDSTGRTRQWWEYKLDLLHAIHVLSPLSSLWLCSNISWLFYMLRIL